MPAEDSVALTGFLRGLQRRARVFAHWQAGDPDAIAPALAHADARFRQQAPLRPMGDWPRLYWRMLLDAPGLRMPLRGPQLDIPPGIARLGHGPRAVLLLGLVAGLDDETAAAVLGTPVASYRMAREQLLPANQLGRPDMDVWKAWQAAALRAQAQPELPDHAHPPHRPQPGWVQPEPPAPAPAPRPRPRWLLRLLWLGVLACAAALAATFWWQPTPELEARLHGDVVRLRVLAAPASPKARMDAGQALCLHPDLAMLQAPELEPVTTALAFHAWFAMRPGTTLQPGVAMPMAVDAPAAEDPQACARRLAQLDAAARQSLEQAVAHFDALPPVARRAPRERWQAWWALSAGERVQLLQAAGAFAALPAEERAKALEEFRALPPEQQYGWRLGPMLGASYPGLHDLVAQLPAHQREPLLAVLRGLSAGDRDTLARLAASTPPEQRQALREDLLALPAHQRVGWLRRRLAAPP